jgi:predicted dehydrogenase
LEKPGALHSWELRELVKKSEEMNGKIYINYQRSYDERVKKMLSDIK